MSGFELGHGVDPVPVQWRRAEPARHRLARALEADVEIDVHPRFVDPIDPEETQWEQRVHVVSYPEGYEPEVTGSYVPPLTAGWVYYLAGAWFWRPRLAREGAPSLAESGLEQEPSEELEVETEQEAILHARRRVAWEVAE